MICHQIPKKSRFCFLVKMALVRHPIAAIAFGIAAVGTVYAMPAKPADVPRSASLQLLSTSAVYDSSGNAYNIDTSINTVYKTTSSAVQTTISCCVGLAVDTLNKPRGLSLDNAGDLYIADSGNNRIVKISSTSEISLVDTGSYQLSAPAGIAVDASGDLYIADSGNNRIVKISSGGQSSLVNTGSYSLANPQSVAVDQNDTLYVADTGNNRVVAISPSGSSALLLANQLNSPLSIASDENGNLYIGQTGDAIELSQGDGSGSGETPSVVASVSSTNEIVQIGKGIQAPVTTMTITLTPHGGFNRELELGIFGMPPNTFGDLTPPTIQFDGHTPIVETFQFGDIQPGQSISLTENQKHSNLHRKSQRSIVLASMCPLTLLFLVGLCGSGRQFPISKEIIGIIALVIFLPAMAITISGCAGGFPSGINSPSTYTATIVARPTNGIAAYPLGSFLINVSKQR